MKNSNLSKIWKNYDSIKYPLESLNQLNNTESYFTKSKISKKQSDNFYARNMKILKMKQNKIEIAKKFSEMQKSQIEENEMRIPFYASPDTINKSIERLYKGTQNFDLKVAIQKSHRYFNNIRDITISNKKAGVRNHSISTKMNMNSPSSEAHNVPSNYISPRKYCMKSEFKKKVEFHKTGNQTNILINGKASKSPVRTFKMDKSLNLKNQDHLNQIFSKQDLVFDLKNNLPHFHEEKVNSRKSCKTIKIKEK